jgi:hypothetical protein
MMKPLGRKNVILIASITPYPIKLSEIFLWDAAALRLRAGQHRNHKRREQEAWKKL